MSSAAEGKRGIAVFLGNSEAPQNYRGNDYKFRQDSSFLYFWGLDEPDLAAILDLDNGAECLYGNNVDLEDIIWMGPQPHIQEKADSVGVAVSAPLAAFDAAVLKAVSQGRPVHYLPISRYHNELKLRSLVGELKPSQELVKAVISMRLVKEQCEIDAIDAACEIGYDMHTIARRGCKVGEYEQEIVGRMEGLTISRGWGVSFPTILSQHGETMHGHLHDAYITPGRLLLVDAGAESNEHYCSDFTRTYPCSGKFTQMQKDIYDIVEACNEHAFQMVAPGVAHRDVHLSVAKMILEGLSDLGLVKGDIDEMVAAGIAGIFMPHGLGHTFGLDCHDMEDLGEDLVGYDEDQTRSPQIGLGNLRMARRFRPGNTVTDEPGIYFIPALIEKWKEEKADKGCVNYAALEKYYNFGGIRLEDDVLITPEGSRRFGSRRLPIKSSEIEEVMANE
ncbi:MAG: Xaa-Pro aminopeptidase [Bacteroidales bacterium]|nr:Xaa-Pro aminopeptidase [Bacteroidales bacterium]